MMILWTIALCAMITLFLSYSDTFCQAVADVSFEFPKRRCDSDEGTSSDPPFLMKPREGSTALTVTNSSPIQRLITLFTSDNPEESQEAYRFLCEIPLSSVEPQLFRLLSGTSSAKVKENTARLLLERGSENAFEPLAQYFGSQERGIAGFLDSNDYNKVVNLFGRATTKHY